MRMTAHDVNSTRFSLSCTGHRREAVQLARQLSWPDQGLTAFVCCLCIINVRLQLCDFSVSGELVKSCVRTYVGTMYYMAVRVCDHLFEQAELKYI